MTTSPTPYELRYKIIENLLELNHDERNHVGKDMDMIETMVKRFDLMISNKPISNSDTPAINIDPVYVNSVRFREFVETAGFEWRDWYQSEFKLLYDARHNKNIISAPLVETRCFKRMQGITTFLHLYTAFMTTLGNRPVLFMPRMNKDASDLLYHRIFGDDAPLSILVTFEQLRGRQFDQVITDNWTKSFVEYESYHMSKDIVFSIADLTRVSPIHQYQTIEML